LKQKETDFPWSKSTPPANIEDALDWVTVQSHLIEYGYSESQIQELYKLPRKNAHEQLSGYIEPSNQTMQTGPLGIHAEPAKFNPGNVRFLPVRAGTEYFQGLPRALREIDGGQSGDGKQATGPKK
jgi:hypothetical protein